MIFVCLLCRINRFVSARLFGATINQEMPYVMRKRDANLTGNDRFEGFCIDLLKTIAENLGFQYQLYLVPDGKFGAEDVQSKQWNGLVRELMDKVRHLFFFSFFSFCQTHFRHH